MKLRHRFLTRRPGAMVGRGRIVRQGYEWRKVRARVPDLPSYDLIRDAPVPMQRLMWHFLRKARGRCRRTNPTTNLIAATRGARVSQPFSSASNFKSRSRFPGSVSVSSFFSKFLMFSFQLGAERQGPRPERVRLPLGKRRGPQNAGQGVKPNFPARKRNGRWRVL